MNSDGRNTARRTVREKTRDAYPGSPTSFRVSGTVQGKRNSPLIRVLQCTVCTPTVMIYANLNSSSQAPKTAGSRGRRPRGPRRDDGRMTNLGAFCLVSALVLGVGVAPAGTYQVGSQGADKSAAGRPEENKAVPPPTVPRRCSIYAICPSHKTRPLSRSPDTL